MELLKDESIGDVSDDTEILSGVVGQFVGHGESQWSFRGGTIKPT